MTCYTPIKNPTQAYIQANVSEYVVSLQILHKSPNKAPLAPAPKNTIIVNYIPYEASNIE